MTTKPVVINDVITSNSNGGRSGSGSVAMKLLASGMNVQGLRTLDVLRKDEWILYDTAVVEVARERLVGVGDLLSRGLRFGVTNPLGVTRIEWEKVSDMDPAEISMDGITPPRRDRVEFSLDSVPLPIVHKDFRINIRALEASRRTGETLDTTQARLATRLVTEKNEAILFNGASLVSIGSTIYGYKTVPTRNTGALVDYDAAAATFGSDFVKDVIKMMKALIADNMYGPYGLYVPKLFFANLTDDYKTNSDKSILSRVLELPDLQFVRPSNNLTMVGTLGDTGTEFLMVNFTSDVVDMAVGQEPTPLQWEEMGGLIINFKVMSIMIPRMKSDASGQSGIAHFTIP